MPEKASAVVLAFFMPKKPSCFWNTFLERRKSNEKTNPSALAQKSVQTCCVQAAGKMKGGKKACKVPAENGICLSHKALSASESRCICPSYRTTPLWGKRLWLRARSSRTPVTASMRRYILWVRKPKLRIQEYRLPDLRRKCRQ